MVDRIFGARVLGRGPSNPGHAGQHFVRLPEATGSLRELAVGCPRLPVASKREAAASRGYR